MKKLLSTLADDKHEMTRKIVYISLSAISAIIVFLLLFAPFCDIVVSAYEVKPATPIGAFSGLSSSSNFAAIQLTLLILLVGVILVNAFFLFVSIIRIANESTVAKYARRAQILNCSTVAVYTAFSFLFSPINNTFGGSSLSRFNPTYIIIAAVIAVLYAVFSGALADAKADSDDAKLLEKKSLEQRAKQRRAVMRARLELLIYSSVVSVLGVVALISNIITVNYTSEYGYVSEGIHLSGLELIKNPQAFANVDHRTIAYVIWVLMLLVLAALFLSLVSFFSHSEFFGKITLSSIAVAVASSLSVGLFSQYFVIVQKLNDDMLSQMIGVNIEKIYSYTVSGSSIYFFLIALAVLAVMFFRRPYSRALELEKRIESEDAARMPHLVEISASEDGAAESSTAAPAYSTDPESESFDPCPAFTALDGRAEEFSSELAKRREALFGEPTLPRLVDFIVQYARDSRLHLYYTQENVAAFLAGLGTTRLTILQGMSGTGKTSLPKIVAEALMSVCDIIEVESSWRDKNELLGYYNEFSKSYTPKKFTQSLYRACLNPEIITFIVLDEMNLSRIEYYFSDLLSIMENEPDKRELSLLNIPIARRHRGKFHSYTALEGGHVLRIPENVWFIGTANRDESTFDISDKVYDRANTMNFDRRAAKIQYYNEPIAAKYLPSSVLLGLFEDAKGRIDFTLEQYPIIAEVEKLLEPYNISFGNRIALQMESFVKIYAACFTANDLVIRDALETILLSKVVRKLELKSIEDKEELADSFAALKLNRCSDFILSLKED